MYMYEQSNVLVIYHQAKHAKLTENTDEASDKNKTGQERGNSDMPLVELRIRMPNGQVSHMSITYLAEVYW